ncbi:MAG: hypothetical protein JNN07_16550 [Verrucomicrobiales bacterium]|nr:hypothetical protein [Verrucomicrobiales bacterium]
MTKAWMAAAASLEEEQLDSDDAPASAVGLVQRRVEALDAPFEVVLERN